MKRMKTGGDVLVRTKIETLVDMINSFAGGRLDKKQLRANLKLHRAHAKRIRAEVKKQEKTSA
jgi:hypothetical protein